MCRKGSQRGSEWIFIEEFCGTAIATLRSGRLRGLVAQMAKAKANRVKGFDSRHGESVLRGTRGRWKRWKWIWIALLVLLLIPGLQVGVVPRKRLRLTRLGR